MIGQGEIESVSGNADNGADQGAGQGAGQVESNNRLESIIQKMINSQDPEVIAETYKAWASDYDADLQSYGYVAPLNGSRQLHAELGNTDAVILDAGCGTGLVGVCLQAMGYRELHGTDFSEAMLENAKARNLYASLSVSDFTHSVQGDDASFDAVICIGVYKDIFKGVLIAEMLRLCKPGGIVVFTARPHYAELACSELDAAWQAGQQNGTGLSYRAEVQPYMTGQNADATYFTVRKGVT